MVKEITPKEAILQDGRVIPFGMCVWSTGVGPTPFTNSLAFAKTARGRLAVDKYLRILPLVNNYDDETQDWRGDVLAAMLADPAARRRTVLGLLGRAREGAFAGICLDFEAFPAKSRDACPTKTVIRTSLRPRSAARNCGGTS